MPEWGSSKQLPEERALYLSDADSILSLTNTDPADPASREAVADDGFVRVPRDLLKPFVAVAKHIGTKDGVAIGWNHDHICLQDIVRLAAAAPPALALSDELGGEG